MPDDWPAGRFDLIVISEFAYYLSREQCTALAAAAAFTAALASLVGVFNAWIAPLVAQAFNTQYGQFIGLAFPPIAGSCLATLASAFLAIQVYKLGQRIATVSASA